MDPVLLDKNEALDELLNKFKLYHPNETISQLILSVKDEKTLVGLPEVSDQYIESKGIDRLFLGAMIYILLIYQKDMHLKKNFSKVTTPQSYENLFFNYLRNGLTRQIYDLNKEFNPDKS